MATSTGWKSLFTGVPGWETVDEQKLLMEYAKLVPVDGTIVEIGSEFGMSSSLFVLAADYTVEIYAIDLFPDDVFERYRQNLKDAGMEFRTLPVKADSHTYWRSFEAEIDLLFVDGDHSYAGVKADIEGWIPLIKPGGIVIFHDCACPTNRNPHHLHYEISKAINEWHKVSDFKFIKSVDTCMVFERDQ